jgi:hypothetical protein
LREHGSIVEGRWGQLLIIPTEGYLEGPGGPVPLRDVEWVELSTLLVRGGTAGRPLEFVDIKNDILSALHGTLLPWELRYGTWSIEGLFEGEALEVVRVLNPFVQPVR